jgi:hypothetical protein
MSKQQVSSKLNSLKSETSTKGYKYLDNRMFALGTDDDKVSLYGMYTKENNGNESLTTEDPETHQFLQVMIFTNKATLAFRTELSKKGSSIIVAMNGLTLNPVPIFVVGVQERCHSENQYGVVTREDIPCLIVESGTVVSVENTRN